jgi:hypothetical protein
MIKQYAIFNPTTNLYSMGYIHSIQQWNDMDHARLWDEIGPVKAHIRHTNKLAKHHNRTLPYDSTMLIVEVMVTRNHSNNTMKVSV